MRKLSKALAGGAALALVGIAVPAATAATSSTSTTTSVTAAPDATLVYATPLRRITFTNTAYAPGAFGLDTDGDKAVDVFGYCVEPGVLVSSGVTAKTQKLAAYDSTTRTFLQDAGRVRWVASHGYGAASRTELAAKAGVTINPAPGGADDNAMISATQAAIWRFSSGLVVNPRFMYGDTYAENTIFQKVYAYLTSQAVPVDAKTTVYDEKPGQAKTQGVVVVTPPAPEPTPEPTKTTDPTPTPTKTTDPAPAPTTTPTSDPTKTVNPPFPVDPTKLY